MAETKLLSYVNEGYLDFAVNWLKYIRKLNMQSMSIVYCLDDSSLKECRKKMTLKQNDGTVSCLILNQHQSFIAKVGMR